MSRYINADCLIARLEHAKETIVASHPLVTEVHRSAMDFAIEMIESMPYLEEVREHDGE